MEINNTISTVGTENVSDSGERQENVDALTSTFYKMFTESDEKPPDSVELPSDNPQTDPKVIIPPVLFTGGIFLDRGKPRSKKK